MAKYQRAITPEELEEQEEERLRLEQEEAEKAKQEEEDLKKPDPDPEEDTFKKRYGDLRAYSQRKEKEYEERIQRLEAQLEEAAKSQLELKDIASEEDAKAWAAKYPELAKIFRFFAVEESKESSEKLKKDIEKLNEMRANAERQAAYAKLLELHPDFNEIRMDDKFHEWVNNKGGWVYDALYHNDTDATRAADAITLYKAENKVEAPKEEPKKEKKKDLGAAERVTRQSNANPSDGRDTITWSESYIEEMSKKDPKFFDKNEDKIMEAIRTNKFVYDITLAE